MQIKDELKGGTRYEDMELFYDEELKEYVLRPTRNGVQSSMRDMDEDETRKNNRIGQAALANPEDQEMEDYEEDGEE